MFPGGILLDKCHERIASFGQFSVLTQLEHRLKLRQADVLRWWGRDFSTLLLFHCNVFFDKGIVTEPRGATEDHKSETKDAEPPQRSEHALTTRPGTRHPPSST